ncbi:MAG: hypothetical protein MK081_13400 [Flavobacteriales bacterium]|nr:hypothetical protein [Flavobacteriales bacterium]
MKNFSTPGGRDYLSIRSANPNPARRFVVTVSNGFALGIAGLRDLSTWLTEQADEFEKAEKAAAKAAKAAERKAKAAEKKAQETEEDTEEDEDADAAS